MRRKNMIRLLLLIIGIVLILDTIVIKSLTTGNLGTYLPALMGIPLLIVGLFFVPLFAWFDASRLGAVVKWVLIAGYAAAILFFTILGTLIYTKGHEGAPKGADAVIVLGAGLRGDRVSLTLQYRLDAAYDYLQQNPDTVLILSGGQGEGEAVTEASAMREYLRLRGVSDDRLLLEGASTSTYENFQYSLALIQKALGNNATVVFITTEFHVYRASLVAKAIGLTTSGIGVKGVWYLAPNDYLRESIALAVYWLNGKV